MHTFSIALFKTYTYIIFESGIASNTIEPKRIKSVEMQYHWLRDRVQMQNS